MKPSILARFVKNNKFIKFLQCCEHQIKLLPKKEIANFFSKNNVQDSQSIGDFHQFSFKLPTRYNFGVYLCSKNNTKTHLIKHINSQEKLEEKFRKLFDTIEQLYIATHANLRGYNYQFTKAAKCQKRTFPKIFDPIKRIFEEENDKEHFLICLDKNGRFSYVDFLYLYDDYF